MIASCKKLSYCKSREWPNSVDIEMLLDCFGLGIPVCAFFVALAMTLLMLCGFFVENVASNNVIARATVLQRSPVIRPEESSNVNSLMAWLATPS